MVETTYPLLPTESTKCAWPVFSWRIWNAWFMLSGVSPLAIASFLRSSANLLSRFSVSAEHEPLSWNLCESAFHASFGVSSRPNPSYYTMFTSGL